MDKPRYSVIVPVYNRPVEVEDLLGSLQKQTRKDFEVIIVEDGSTISCRAETEKYAGELDVHYFWKANEGRSIARNYGIERSQGEWLVFFDSDCVIPYDYFDNLSRALDQNPLDCYGGPDAAHESFSPVQKAINFAMTSFITTGGIRGGKISMEKFTPRSFNMGYRRKVYDEVGGFREMFSEDIDMSTRIRQAGYKIGLIAEAPVYHKRRVDFRKFFRQVHVFGMSRITLKLLYSDSLKLVHTLPALAVLIALACIVFAIVFSPWWLLPLAIYGLALIVCAAISTKSLKVTLLSLPAGVIQIVGYGTGFLRAWFGKILLRRGRDIQSEIEMRRGK
ncbi:MAG: glycosyltransferase [Paramuribaculum sp.]|nr:glycosyltransferase [Paramuribaculum sp.]